MFSVVHPSVRESKSCDVQGNYFKHSQMFIESGGQREFIRIY